MLQIEQIQALVTQNQQIRTIEGGIILYMTPEKNIDITPNFLLGDIRSDDTPAIGSTNMYKSNISPMADCGTDNWVICFSASEVWCVNHDSPCRGVENTNTIMVRTVYVRAVVANPNQAQIRSHCS